MRQERDRDKEREEIDTKGKKGSRRAGLVSSLSFCGLLFLSSCTHLVSELRGSNWARERQFPRERNNDLTSSRVRVMITRKYGTHPHQYPPLNAAPEAPSIVWSCCCSCCILLLLCCILHTSNVRNWTSMESVAGCSSSHSIIWFCVQFLGRGANLIFKEVIRQTTTLTRWEFLGGRSVLFERLTMAPVQGEKEVHCCAQQVQLTTRTKLFYHYQNRRRLFTCAVAMRRSEFWLHWRSSSCYVNTIMDTVSRNAAIIKKWLMTSSLWCGVITHWCNGACHEDFWWLNSVDWWYKEARTNGVAWVTIVRITQNWVARLYRFSVLIVPHRVESLKYIVLAS